jgi:midasin
LAAADHLLDIYIQLTGEKHLHLSGYKQVSQEVSETRRENRRLILEGRELSLRY